MNRTFIWIVAISLSSLTIGLTSSCKKKSECTLQAPENVSCSHDKSVMVDVSWEGNSGADEYIVYRAKKDAMGAIGEYKEAGRTRSERYEDKEVESGCEYSYKVEAHCENGGYEMSDAVDATTISISVVEAFEVLGASTGGEATNCPSASELPGTINDVIDNHIDPGTDLVFLIDNTGSMYDDIDYVKNQLNTILANLPANTRVGMAYYKDLNCDNPWYASVDLTTNTSSVSAFLNSMYASGGCDLPESVYDGIYKTVNEMNWRNGVNRAVIVIGDAPPLDGSLSQHTLADVINVCNASGVVTNVFPILTSVSTVSPFRGTQTTLHFQEN